MIKVNLLPPDLRKKKKVAFLDKVLIYVILALILEIAGLFFVDWQQKNEIENLIRDISLTRQEIQKYQPILEAINEAEKLRDNIQTRMAAIQSLETQRPLWVKTLEELANVLSDQLWYDEIVYNGQNSKISIQANSYSLNDIAKFMINLMGSAYFREVSLGEVSKEGKESNAYEFSTSMTLVKDQTKATEGEFKIKRKKKEYDKAKDMKPLDLEAKGRDALGVDKDKARKAMEGLAP